MKDVHFIAIESMNFATGGVFNDVVLSVHRHHTAHADKKLQLSFPEAVKTGFQKNLGRRAVIFGLKQDLELFWSNNADDIEQTFSLVNEFGNPVQSLEKLIQNQPQAIIGHAICSRYRIKRQSRLLAEKIDFLKSKGYSVDEKALIEQIKKRIAESPKTVETIKMFSKTDQKPMQLNVAIKDVKADAHVIDPSTINSYGLSTTNIVPILRL